MFYLAGMILSNLDSKNVSPVTIYSMVMSIPSDSIKHPYIQFVLKVTKAFDSGDYIEYLKLYRIAPKSLKHIMRITLDKVRVKALRTLLLVMKQTITKEYLYNILHFNTQEEFDEFFGKHQVVLDAAGNIVCDLTVVSLAKSK